MTDIPNPTVASEIAFEALRWVNQWRFDHDMPRLRTLPCGVRGDQDNCPIARATGLSVHVPGMFTPDGRPIGKLPPVVTAFSLMFDQGVYPNLEEGNNGRAA